MQQNQTQVIVRFTQACETEVSISKLIGRVTGLINAENFSKLMSVMDIDSNPRKPKESSVTRDICDTLSHNPELFHLMSKGVLISASSCQTLDRNRFKVDFEHTGYALPGILDGGHNSFAIAKFILSKTNAELKSAKDWESLVPVWFENIDNINELFNDPERVISLGLNFLIPIEVIFPRDTADIEVLNFWGESHRDITHARNNNAQLTDSTKDHHQGFYEYLKETLPESIRRRIEWKTNDGGTIKAADIVSLALIPLSMLPTEVTGVEINLTKIYNSKQYCVEVFRQILELEGNGYWKGQAYSLTNPLIMSALDLVPDIIETYDFIYKNFPDAYNKADGSFGRISGVRIYDPKKTGDQKYAKKPFFTKYTLTECDYSYADGFIVPLVVGLKELIVVDATQNKLYWKYEPKLFIYKCFSKVLGMYSALIRATNWDPQKIGKDKGSYEIVSGAIQIAASTYNK